jgi:hypothetical protein
MWHVVMGIEMKRHTDSYIFIHYPLHTHTIHYNTHTLSTTHTHLLITERIASAAHVVGTNFAT